MAAFPELAWLDRHHYVAPAALMAALWAVGTALELWAPALHTSGAQLIVCDSSSAPRSCTT